jgi:asparagine synthase (glutamine-hydrolysing)
MRFVQAATRLARGGALDPVPTVIMYPPEAPVVAVAADGSDPRVQVAQRADGSFSVLYGEVYDRSALQAEGAAGRDLQDDAAAFLERCLAEGPSVMARMDSAAMLTVWDAARETLLVFRDRVGVPPAFHAQAGRALLWAADMKTLWQIGLPPTVNLGALDFFLATGYIPAPWTLLEQIRRVPPSHYLMATRDAVRIERWWWPAWRPKVLMTPAGIAERYGFYFSQALRRRTRCGGRYGVLLSGGVDSALIAAGLVRLLGLSVDTFTFRYSEYDGPFNEGESARKIADSLGVPHQEIDFGPQHVLDRLERLVWTYEEPFTSGLNCALLDPVAAAGVTVLFTGAGNGQWERRRSHYYAAQLAKLPRPLLAWGMRTAASVERAAPFLRGKVSALFRLAALPVERMYYRDRTVAVEQWRRQLYCREEQLSRGLEESVGLLAGKAREVADESALDQYAHLALSFSGPEFVPYWMYRWGSECHVWPRYPFWDRELLEWALRVRRPWGNERRWTDKADLRDFARTLLPVGAASAPKLPQTIPLATWFRGPLKEMLYSYLSADRLKRDGLFRPDVVRTLLDRHMAGASEYTFLLWSLLVFHVWEDVFMPARSPDFGPALGVV